MRMLVLVFSLVCVGFAQESKHVEVQLLSRESKITRGVPFLVGIKMTMREHWHTYWKNPGSSGLPTTLTLNPIPGFSLGQLQFPLPKKFVDDAGFVTYGYDDSTLLIAEAIYRGEASSILLEGKAEWLECKEVCIPGSAAVSLPLQIGTPEPSPHAALFQTYQKRMSQAYGQDAPYLYESSFRFESGTWLGSLVLHAKKGSKLPQTASAYRLFPERIGEGDADLKDARFAFHGDRVEIQLAYEAYVDKPASGTRIGAILQVGGEQNPIYQLALFPQVTLPAESKAAVESLVPDPSTASKGASESLNGGVAVSALGKEALEKSSTRVPKAVATEANYSYGVFLLFALLGGIILNLMPCVLPVLSLKLFSIIEEASSSPMIRIRHAWITTLGIQLSFLALSLFFVSSKFGGESLGVGFQFQNPYFVIFMLLLVFVMGLSFFGVFHLEGPNSNLLYDLTQRGGWQGPFFQGALLTVLSTPCTAPLLGAAYAWALTQSWFTIILVFQMIGFGLALPYLVLCHSPRLMSLLPKPGAWMNHLKITMGFFLMATVVWLLNILADQTGRWGMNGMLTVLLGVSFSAYVFGRIAEGARWTNAVWILGALTISVYFGFFRFFDITDPKGRLNEDKAYQRLKYLNTSGETATNGRSALDSQRTTAEKIAWIPYSVENLAYLRGQNRLIFLDFTATWCATCKANEALFIDTAAAREVFARHDVAMVKVDYTDRSDEITNLLRSFNRAAVPLYVFMPGMGEPIVLPEAINQSILFNGLDEARAGMSQSTALPRK